MFKYLDYWIKYFKGLCNGISSGRIILHGSFPERPDSLHVGHRTGMLVRASVPSHLLIPFFTECTSCLLNTKWIFFEGSSEVSTSIKPSWASLQGRVRDLSLFPLIWALSQLSRSSFLSTKWAFLLCDLTFSYRAWHLAISPRRLLNTWVS